VPKPDWDKRYCAGKGDWRRGGPEEEARFRKNYDRIDWSDEDTKVSCNRCRHFDWISDWCDYPDSRRRAPVPDEEKPPCGGELFEEE
jgi:hypothetical protein